MIEVDATDTDGFMAELLTLAEYGETVVITREGETVAMLVPIRVKGRAERMEASERFWRWRAEREPTGLTQEEILALRHEGHRY